MSSAPSWPGWTSSGPPTGERRRRPMPDRWPQGMTAAQREQRRELLMEWYADHGHDEGHEMRKMASSACAIGSHGSCGGEEPGAPGCPCECHDARADEVAAKTAALRAAAR